LCSVVEIVEIVDIIEITEISETVEMNTVSKEYDRRQGTVTQSFVFIVHILNGIYLPLYRFNS